MSAIGAVPAASAAIPASRELSSRFSSSRSVTLCLNAAISRSSSACRRRSSLSFPELSSVFTVASAAMIAVRSTSASVRGVVRLSPRFGVRELSNVRIAGNETRSRMPCPGAYR
jgi:hypothetical protein